MKKSRFSEFLNLITTLFILVVFVIFSTGVVVNIHESCKNHHHLCCDNHHESDNVQALAFYSSTDHILCDISLEKDEILTTLDHDHIDKEITSCGNHTHCFLITYILKISDAYFGVDNSNYQLKSILPIQMFANISHLELQIEASEMENNNFKPPKRFESGIAFINFTSQRLHYA
jgi:hypothetical protein